MPSKLTEQFERGNKTATIRRLAAGSREYDVGATAGAAVATDAREYSGKDITATASFTLSNPTGPTNGQCFTWRIFNNSGSAITVTLGNQFNFGTNVTSFPDIAAGDAALLAAVYRTLGGVTVWDVVAADAF